MAYSVGPVNFSAFADDATVGTVAWTNPTNASASDNSYASAQTSNASALSASDNSVKIVKGGTIQGTDLAAAGSWPSADAYASYGDTTAVTSPAWGVALARADVVASNFGFAISSKGGSTTHYLKATTPANSAIASDAFHLGVKLEFERHNEAISCLLPGTMISTPLGDIPIEKIVRGDFVYGYNKLTKKIEKARVTAIRVTQQEEYFKIYVAGRFIDATASHKFYTAQGLKKVAQLVAGETLYLIDGSKAVIDGITRIGSASPVYEMTVAKLHNYFAQGLLVHNSIIGSGTTTQFIDHIRATFFYDRAYVVNRTDSTTETDAIVKKPVKNFADSVTSSDAIVKNVGKNLSDSVSESEVISFNNIKALAEDTATTTDQISNNVVKTTTDSVTSSDANLKNMTKSQTDSVNDDDALVNNVGKNLDDSVSTADQFSDTMQFVRDIDDAATPTDSISNSVGKSTTDSTTASDSIVKNFTKYIDDLVEVLDATNIPRLLTLLLSDSATSSDDLVKAVGKALSDIETVSDVIAQRTVNYVRSLSDSTTPQDQISNGLGKSLSDLQSMADSLSFTVGKGLSDTAVTLDDTAKAVAKTLSDTALTTDEILTIIAFVLLREVALGDQSAAITLSNALKAIGTTGNTMAKADGYTPASDADGSSEIQQASSGTVTSEATRGDKSSEAIGNSDTVELQKP